MSDTTKTRGWRGYLLLITGAGILVGLALNWLLTEPQIFNWAPYEDWDEIMAYNQAAPMSLQSRFAHATYGSVEEAKFRLAKLIYKNFDSVGKHFSVPSYSNSVLDSFQQPHKIYEVRSFDATYARGILDRRPFVIARFITLIGSEIMLAALCCFWTLRFGNGAWFVAVPALWFGLSDGFISQDTLALPNAWNVMLALIIFAALLDTIERRKHLGLYISSALFALGLNTKIDFMFVGIPIIATWILSGLGRKDPVRAWIRSALLSALWFVAVLVLTNPRLLYATPLVISEQERLLTSVNSGLPDIGYNRTQLTRFFLGRTLGANKDLVRLHLVSVLACLAVCSLFPISVALSSRLDVQKKWRILALLSLFYLSLWVTPVFLARSAYDRYFLSGSAVAMVSIGYAGYYLWRERALLCRSVGGLIFLLCLIFSLGRGKEVSIRDEWEKHIVAHGMDTRASRNQAVLEMIRLVESGQYANQVITDQHSYTDIRAFLERGISVTLINSFNFEQQLRKIASTGKPVLGLYAPGEDTAEEKWEGKWDDKERARYHAYLEYLEKFQTVTQFGSKPMPLLDWAPPDADDRVVIFEVKPNETGSLK